MDSEGSKELDSEVAGRGSEGTASPPDPLRLHRSDDLEGFGRILRIWKDLEGFGRI